jgi:hypothetical protein
MWLSRGITGLRKCYFYPEKFYCYNLFEKCRFAVEDSTRKDWETGGMSNRIGADCLGEWIDG